MNDQQLDTLGREAAARTRAEARAIADSDAALRRLLADVTAPPATEPDVVVPYIGRLTDTGDANRWKFGVAAAVVAVFMLGIGYALVRGSGTIEIAGPPAGGTGTAPGSAPAGTAPSGSSPSVSAPSGTVPTSTPGGGSSPEATAPPATLAPTTAPAPADPTAGFVVPELEPVTIDDVPYLLPDPAPAPERAIRDEFGISETPISRTQVWVRTDRRGVVDGVAWFTTSKPDALGQFGGEPIDVPGWDAMRIDADDATFVELRAAPIVVNAWITGVSQDDALGILRDIRADGEQWAAPRLDASGWTELPSAWAAASIGRRLVVLDGAEGDIDSEVSVEIGVSPVQSGLLDPALAPTLVDVAGDPGLLYLDGAAKLIVARSDGVTVRLGSRDPDADLVAVATSLDAVDAATWESATSPLPDGWDGCMSFFC